MDDHGMIPGSSFRLTYRPSLDGLRGIAVLMVMLCHSGFAPGGFLGVDVFFVLSGFLITALLMQERSRTGSISLRNFFARRVLRLLPALITLLSLMLLLPRLFGFGGRPWKLALVVFFYFANWVMAFQRIQLGVLSPTWSLSIEEQFYLLWPPLLALLLVLRVRRSAILGLVLFGIAAASIERVVMWDTFGVAAWSRLYWGLDTRMDSLLLGCLLGLLAAWDMLPKQRKFLTLMKTAAAPAAATLLILAYGAPDPTSEDLYMGVDLVACVSAAAVIVALITSPPKMFLVVLEQPALVWIGRISYGLYLWHVPIFHGVLNEARMARLGITGLPLQLVRWAVAFGVAAASFYLVERRVLTVKNRFRGRPHPVPSVVAPSRTPNVTGCNVAKPASARDLVIVSHNEPERYWHVAQEAARHRGAQVIVDRRMAERRVVGPARDSSADIHDRRRTQRRSRPEVDAEIRSIGYAIVSSDSAA